MVTIRKDMLVVNSVYHIFTRSIAGYEVFRDQETYQRFINSLEYFNQPKPPLQFSKFLLLSSEVQRNIIESRKADPIVQIIAYCLMPTHPHLILKQLTDAGISTFMSNVLNSFTRYYNNIHNRKGPLWESEFKNVIVDSDNQLLHLTRYIHLNPVSAGLVNSPNKWNFSSYKQYIGETKNGVCNWQEILVIDPVRYRKFVLDRVAYQQELSKIKKLLIDGYSG